MNARKLFTVLLLLTLASLLAPAAKPAPVTVEIRSITVGKSVGGRFVAVKDRVLRPGETLYAYTGVLVSGRRGEAYRLNVTYTILDPFNHTLTEASTVSVGRLLTGEDRWKFPFTLELRRDMHTGIYTIQVRVDYGGGSVQARTWFMLVGGVENENIVEIEYRVTLAGNGKISSLYVALVHETSWTQILAGPIFSPKPSRIVSDTLGNKYAVYENIRGQRGKDHNHKIRPKAALRRHRRRRANLITESSPRSRQRIHEAQQVHRVRQPPDKAASLKTS